MSSHSDQDSDNDETVDELVSSHSDQDSDNDGTIDELVSSHSDHDWEFRYFKLEFIHE